MGDVLTALLRAGSVRVDYGRCDDDGRPDPYQLKFWLVDSTLGTRFELINHRELRRRHQFASDNGDDYDASDVEVNSGALFEYAERLEAQETTLKLLELAQRGEGVQIFIGAQNELFGLSGCTTIVAPYRDAQDRIVGAIGVVGPTRLNYARIIPMVDYTARVVGRLVG